MSSELRHNPVVVGGPLIKPTESRPKDGRDTRSPRVGKDGEDESTLPTLPSPVRSVVHRSRRFVSSKLKQTTHLSRDVETVTLTVSVHQPKKTSLVWTHSGRHPFRNPETPLQLRPPTDVPSNSDPSPPQDDRGSHPFPGRCTPRGLSPKKDLQLRVVPGHTLHLFSSSTSTSGAPTLPGHGPGRPTPRGRVFDWGE